MYISIIVLPGMRRKIIFIMLKVFVYKEKEVMRAYFVLSNEKQLIYQKNDR